MRRQAGIAAFTWLEIAVALAIVVVLAALVLNTASIFQKKPPADRCARTMLALSTALESYKAEYGDYPKSSTPFGPNETGGANILYQALVISNAAYNPAGKVFFEPSKDVCASTNYGSSANYFRDPFGQPYQYRHPGDPHRSGTNFFDLFSYAGSKKTADTTNNWDTWLRNW